MYIKFKEKKNMLLILLLNYSLDFTIVYIRIISLRWKFDDHPLVEYPLS